jgi:hypothetical protein
LIRNRTLTMVDLSSNIKKKEHKEIIEEQIQKLKKKRKQKNFQPNFYILI